MVSEQFKIGLNRRLDEVVKTVKEVEDTIQDGSNKLSENDKKKAKEYLTGIEKVKDMTEKIKGLLETTSKISNIIG